MSFFIQGGVLVGSILIMFMQVEDLVKKDKKGENESAVFRMVF